MNAQLATSSVPFPLERLRLTLPSAERPRARARALGVRLRSICRLAGWFSAAVLLLGAGYVLGFVTVLIGVSWTLGSEGAFEPFVASGGLLMVCVWSGLWCWNAAPRR